MSEDEGKPLVITASCTPMVMRTAAVFEKTRGAAGDDWVGVVGVIAMGEEGEAGEVATGVGRIKSGTFTASITGAEVDDELGMKEDVGVGVEVDLEVA
jgi:hypothetical protein